MSDRPAPPRLMLPRRTLAIARKELRHITRSTLTLFLVTVSPAILLFSLANVFRFDAERSNLALMDLDKSRASREYMAGLTAGDLFTLVAGVEGYAAVDRVLVAGTADAVVVIPPGFEEAIQAGQAARVQVIVDGSNPLTASQNIGRLKAASSAAMVQVQPSFRPAPVPFDVRSRAWYNATLESLISMVPGLLSIVLSLPALALSLSLTREKELGTLEGLFATPIESTAYLLGKTIAYIMTGLVGALLGWLLAVAWFDVPFRGEMGLFILLTVAYFVASMGVSLFLATWISSQQAAMLLVMLIFFVPSFFLAGLVDPIDRQSTLAVLMSEALPATHYINISRGLFLKGLGAESLARPSLILVAMGAVGLLVSRLIFKKKLG